MSLVLKYSYFSSNYLQTNGTLKSLKIAGNKIDKKGGMALAESLQINSTLEILDCGDCDLEVDSLIALATVLLANTSVKSLCVDRPLIRSVQEEPLVHYGEMLRVNMTLEDLSMEKCEIRDFGTARLCEAVGGNSKLKSLNIRKYYLYKVHDIELILVFFLFQQPNNTRWSN